MKTAYLKLSFHLYNIHMNTSELAPCCARPGFCERNKNVKLPHVTGLDVTQQWEVTLFSPSVKNVLLLLFFQLNVSASLYICFIFITKSADFPFVFCKSPTRGLWAWFVTLQTIWKIILVQHSARTHTYDVENRSPLCAEKETTSSLFIEFLKYVPF